MDMFCYGQKGQEFEIDLSCLWGYNTYDFYTFQDSLLQSPSNISGFGSLRILSLKGVDVTGDTVACILSSSPLLETFTLQNARSLRSLVVYGPVIKLQHLKIKDCFWLTALEISAENLVSFKYCGSTDYPIDMSLRNVPLLSEFLIGGNYVDNWVHHLDKLSHDWSQLHILTLNLHWMVSSRCYSSIFPVKFPEFSNLKHLILKSFRINGPSLAFLGFLLEASPCLSSLKLQVKEQCRLLWSYQQVERHTHNCPKVVELVGWTGVETDIDLATYLLEIAVSLD